MYEALSSFLTDFDFLKDSLDLTQQEVAEKMGTTQSAISRIASLKTNPSYKQLLKMAEAVGGELLVTPMKDMTVQVPYDLQESVRKMAANAGKSTTEYLENVLRNAVELERAIISHIEGNRWASKFTLSRGLFAFCRWCGYARSRFPRFLRCWRT
jgi:transcriptional regulator with XRE-family HTH domain